MCVCPRCVSVPDVCLSHMCVCLYVCPILIYLLPPKGEEKAAGGGLFARIIKIDTNNYQIPMEIFFFLGNFTCLEVIFKFRRRLGYYLFHTYIPTCLIVMMSWISFWIKPEAVPARVTLGVTSLLTLSTQHANSQKSLPPVSYIKVRLIRTFHLICYFFM